MKLGLINSAWHGSPVVDLAEGIHLTKKIGFDSIDIFADPMEISVKERRLIGDTCRDVGLPVISVVCCALGIADPFTPVRHFHVDRAKKHLDLAYELRGRNLLVVLGEYIWQQEIIAPKDQWSWAVQHVRELGEYAASLGLEVAVELEPFHISLIRNIENMASFLDDVAHPAVKANLDISHLALGKTPASEIAKVQNRIAHVHFSDCNGFKHGDLPPGRGDIDLLPYLVALKDVGFNGTISIELEYSPEPKKIVEWVTEAYTATDRMMQSLQIRN